MRRRTRPCSRCGSPVRPGLHSVWRPALTDNDGIDEGSGGASAHTRANVSRTATTSAQAPTPRLYHYFDAIVRHGSVRRASEEVGIASSALNRRLLDFEAELGTKLFTRLRHGLRLTPAGEVVAAHVRATIDDGALVADRLRGIDGAVCGPVAIASAESAAMAFLPSIMASTQERFPDLTFVLAVGPPAVLVAQLLAGHADLMLTHEEPSHGDIAVLASASQPFCAVMRAGHPLASHASLLIEDCLAYPTVIAQEDLAARALFDAAIAASARHRKPSLVTNLFEAMKRFVALSDAVSFQFHLRAGEAARDGLVAVPLANRHLVAGRLWLATQRGRVLPPGASEVARRIEAWLTG